MILLVQGSCRQKLLLPSYSLKQTNCLLWGSVKNKVRLLKVCKDRVFSVKAVVSGDVGSFVVDKSTKASTSVGSVIHFFRVPLVQDSANAELLKSFQTKISNQIVGLKTEQCFNIGINSPLSSEKLSVLRWLLQETFEPENLGTESFLDEVEEGLESVMIEVGPRLSFTTAWSANAVSICQACGLTEVNRMERSRRYLLYVKGGRGTLLDSQINDIVAMVHDRMTECVYSQRLRSIMLKDSIFMCDSHYT